MVQLVGLRVIMGVGAGAVSPAALAAVGDIFEESRRGRALGIIGAAQVLASLAGPIVGGWLTDNVGWRWGFFLIVPVGLLAALVAGMGLASNPHRQKGWIREIDWLGSMVLGLALNLGLLGLQAVTQDASLLLPGLGMVILAGLLLTVGVRLAKGHPDPALPLPLLRNPALRQAAIGTLLLGAATYGAVAYLPLYVQGLLSGTATMAGGALWPMLLAAGVATGLGGWLSGRWPNGLIVGIGWSSAGLGFLWLGLSGATGYSPLLIATSALVGLGVGLPLPLFLLVAQDEAGQIQLARNLGGALGVPLLAIWLPDGASVALGPALSAIFFSLVGISASGLLIGVRRRRASSETGAEVAAHVKGENG